jgi:hypothetical protein
MAVQFQYLETCLDPPQPPLRKGGEYHTYLFSSSPFLRGIEGDLLEFLTLETNS